jgi:hypothetical protein
LGGKGRKITKVRPGAALWLAASTLVVSGCQLIGGSEPPPPTLGTVQGVVYQGSLFLDGGDMPAGLEIIRNRGRVRGALQTSSGLIADGQGRSRGNTLTLDLSYGGECPGTISLDGDWDEDGKTYEGAVTAVDCTGKGTGTFKFSGE